MSAAGAASSGAAEGERLAAELRVLRERTGLSLVALAERTPYSKSSWQRYLNGTQPLPRPAVETLCALADEPAGRLLMLWELADASWSGRAETAAATGAATGAADGAGTGAGTGTGSQSRAGAAVSVRLPAAGPVQQPPPARPFFRERRFGLTLAAAAVVALAAVLAGAGLSGDGGGDDRRQDAADATWIQASPRMPGCTGAACEGRNPSVMGCGAHGMVTTVNSLTTAGGQRLELRYGKHCRAIWARASRLRPGDRVVLTVPGAKTARLTATQQDVGRYVSTPMTGAGLLADARVCLRPGDGGSEECFGKR
ncbi:XRE family transcriptional regulator [Streptomyces sp. GMY02]|uniref:helix-turn-helix domain-containing protein n=1 Tax=Streptomyces sp. GMY02 TaxID=1333528 RepID=UPI001C2C03A1|nr:XRE family transcriptional regulator [Streptomyces sp. GMY02]QXE35122.1 XRE family transcriptional regulator [Streptomyces sp. GMY02]